MFKMELENVRLTTFAIYIPVNNFIKETSFPIRLDRDSDCQSINPFFRNYFSIHETNSYESTLKFICKGSTINYACPASHVASLLDK